LGDRETSAPVAGVHHPRKGLATLTVLRLDLPPALQSMIQVCRGHASRASYVPRTSAAAGDNDVVRSTLGCAATTA